MVAPSTENKPVKKAAPKPAAAAKGSAKTAPANLITGISVATIEQIAIAVAEQLTVKSASQLIKEGVIFQAPIKPLDTTKRIGALKGFYVVPDDIDTPFASEIEDMFDSKDH